MPEPKKQPEKQKIGQKQTGPGQREQREHKEDRKQQEHKRSEHQR